jgi:alkylhydroperoxidase/carboxymuconolactone decarboxylase family protein YurZ
MSRIALPDLSDVPAPSREILTAILATGQAKILNLHAGMAVSPATLATYWAMRRTLTEHATLDPRTRFAVMLATAAADETSYTTKLNITLALRAGWSPEDIPLLQHGMVPGDPKLSSLLLLARQIVREYGRVDEADWQEALANGWEPAQLLEATTHVALVLFMDLVVNVLELKDEVPAAEQSTPPLTPDQRSA